jgi:23S rRNA pseudouridine1911/1915/1917 synthase
VKTQRQALHAAELVFAHPATGLRMRFEAPLPDDFRALVAELRKRRSKP